MKKRYIILIIFVVVFMKIAVGVLPWIIVDMISKPNYIRNEASQKEIFKYVNKNYKFFETLNISEKIDKYEKLEDNKTIIWEEERIALLKNGRLPKDERTPLKELCASFDQKRRKIEKEKKLIENIDIATFPKPEIVESISTPSRDIPTYLFKCGKTEVFASEWQAGFYYSRNDEPIKQFPYKGDDIRIRENWFYYRYSFKGSM